MTIIRKFQYLPKERQIFLNTRLVTPYLKVILPVPPSNVNRTRQPVCEIAKKVGAELKVFVDFDYLHKKKKTEQLKDIYAPNERKGLSQDALEIKDLRYENKKALLFDDLYGSGATLRAITKFYMNLVEFRMYMY